MRHRVFRRGKVWHAQYSDPRTGRTVWRSLGVTEKGRANAMLSKIVTEIREHGFFEDKREAQVRFRDFAVDYLAWAHANKRSAKNDEMFVRRFCSEWGDKLLTEVTPHMIEQYKAKRVQEPKRCGRAGVLVSQNHVNHELSVLRGLFNKAIQWGKAQVSPIRHVKFFRVDDRRMGYLDRGQVHALLAACENRRTPYLRAMVVIALGTGLRRGEILNLRWEDVDYKGGVVRVRESKSGRKRAVPMNEDVLEALRSCVALERLAGEVPQSAFVFCDRQGQPYRDVKNGFITARRRAGLSWLHFHDLRHTFASHLVSAGTPLEVIRDLLGHSSYAMTLRYAHLAPDRKVEAVNRLPGSYRPVTEGAGRGNGAGSATRSESNSESPASGAIIERAEVVGIPKGRGGRVAEGSCLLSSCSG